MKLDVLRSIQLRQGIGDFSLGRCGPINPVSAKGLLEYDLLESWNEWGCFFEDPVNGIHRRVRHFSGYLCSQ